MNKTIFDLPYIRLPLMTGDIKADVVNLLSENGRKKTAAHCVKVAATCADLAERFGLDKETAYKSGLLHDISAVIKPDDMMSYAVKSGWYIDACEEKHNFVLHQRISAVVAAEYFNTGEVDILSAVECHSTLKSSPSEYDMALFLADKISWDQNGIPPFIDVLQKAVDVSLDYASLIYINYALDNGMILHPHKWLLEAKRWLEEKHANTGNS